MSLSVSSIAFKKRCALPRRSPSDQRAGGGGDRHGELGLADEVAVDARSAGAALDELHFVRTQRAHVAVVVSEETLGLDRVDALTALFVCRRDSHDVGPLRPRVAGRASVGWTGQDLELVHRRATVAMYGPEAVGTGVTTADDDDVLARGGEGRLREVTFLDPVGNR